jgi:hypothetical protein
VLGATWGVVVEATVKVYPTPKTLLHTVYITSPNATTFDFMGIGNGKSAKGLWDAIAYLGSQFPDMVDRGSGGIFIPTTNGFVGAAIFTGENATEAYAKSVWDPVLNKMKTFPGMGNWTTNSTAFPTYQDFFGTIWPGIGIITGDAGTGPGDSVRYGKMFRSFVDSKVITEANLGHLAPYVISKEGDGVDKSISPYKPNGDWMEPTPGGKLPMDTRLLSRKHLEGLPSAPAEVKRMFATRYIIEIVSGPKTHSLGEDTSVLPAWRKGYVQCYTPYMPPIFSVDVLREYAPDSGAYINEVNRHLKTKFTFLL